MGAHRLVIVAAALTTVVAAALATALATFSGQALPRAVRHGLGQATGTTLVLTGSGRPIPAAIPATAVALLHVTDGDVLRLRDRAY